MPDLYVSEFTSDTDHPMVMIYTTAEKLAEYVHRWPGPWPKALGTIAPGDLPDAVRTAVERYGCAVFEKPFFDETLGDLVRRTQ